MKALSEMTLQELWQLFPIILTEYNPEWKAWYEDEKQALAALLPPDVRINHVGSTAVGTIWAKPTIDILVEVKSEEDFPKIKEILTENGWNCMSEAENRVSFNKGYTPQGFAKKVFHLHLRREGDNDEIYFCEYLKKNPAVAKEYEELKLKLWKAYEHDRDGYTDAKGDFIKKYTEIAKRGE